MVSSPGNSLAERKRAPQLVFAGLGKLHMSGRLPYSLECRLEAGGA